MKIFLHPYELKNLHSEKTREGVLLKIEWSPGRFGYSDLHPWPEFGDETIDSQIENLGREETTPLIERSLEMNIIDHNSRNRSRSAFLGLALPRTHKLVTDADDDCSGFSHVKLKMGEDLFAETKTLLRLAEKTDAVFRLDFNGRLAPENFLAWWADLPTKVRARVDFVEDPGDVHVAGPWAADWQTVASAKIRILKPMREAATAALGFARVVFTHTLDHPLGMAASLWMAAQYYLENPRQLEVCGLGAGAYQANDLSREWSCAGPRMTPPQGTGFGFDSLLNTCKWDRLL